jgi:hypothetical protein
MPKPFEGRKAPWRLLSSQTLERSGWSIRRGAFR